VIQVTPEIAAGQFFDELIRADGEARPGADSLLKFLTDLSPEVLSEKRTALEAAIKSQGISFLVYSDSMNIDRSWPLDLVPRVMQASEWRHTEAGLKQRLKALNLFLNDVYNEQAILRDGIVPTELVTDSPHYIALASGMKPLFETWAHICGSDLVRDHRGQLFVLEDNLRVPSGVSYMLENRSVMKQVYPELFRNHHILPVSQYASDLLDMLNALSPRPVDHPVIVVLTPGIYNSAYFEHSYLAQQIGAELVQGSDLFVDSDDCVYMKAVEGVSRVDVIYRRIDDTFLDPEALNPDSVLGVPGLMRAWRAGKVSIANAPGSGVADDKVLYAYVPEIIQYYLNEKPILENVQTYLCSDPSNRHLYWITLMNWWLNRLTRLVDMALWSVRTPLMRRSCLVEPKFWRIPAFGLRSQRLRFRQRSQSLKMATLPHVMLIYARLFYKARLNGVQPVDYVGWHYAKAHWL
jgi:uncharacterized circularly permuted ATP-grasp superfamily protein